MKPVDLTRFIDVISHGCYYKTFLVENGKKYYYKFSNFQTG